MVVDSGVRGRQLGRPAVWRPKTPVNYACLGRHAAPLHTAVDNGESVRTVFIDFAKGFDRVDHSVLVVKLVALGLLNVIVRWTGVFLRERRQRVKISDALSDWLQMPAGMPQG